MILNPEELVDQNLLHDDKGRQIQTDVSDSIWGQLIYPSATEKKNKTDEGMRVVLFASYIYGYLLTETLREFEKRHPKRLNIVGLVTDDPASPDAKISKKRRIWRLYNQEETIDLETAMIESGLTSGIPVYSGAVKTEYFRALLKKWNPDVIITCVFGQIIDEPIINYPQFGIYNFHPADLLAGHGAGPQPFQDLIDRNAKTSKLTIHQLTVQLDSGPIVGQTPPINVRYADGSITDNILVLEDKLLHTFDITGAILIKALIHHFEHGVKGSLTKLDIERHFSDPIRKWLMEYIASDKVLEEFPEPSKYVDFNLNG